jgi:hypothetical protein
VDIEDNVQGPFVHADMINWHAHGYLNDTLPVAGGAAGSAAPCVDAFTKLGAAIETQMAAHTLVSELVRAAVASAGEARGLRVCLAVVVGGRDDVKRTTCRCCNGEPTQTNWISQQL